MDIQKLILVLFISISVQIYSQIEVTTELEKTVYTQGEPIYALITVKNISDVSYKYIASSTNWACFLYNEDGTQLYSGLENFEPSTEISFELTLEPGECNSIFFPINDLYGSIDLMKNLLTKALLIGKYKVKMSFNDIYIVKGDTIRNNKLFTNELNFEVIESDQEFKNAFIDIENILAQRFDDNESYKNELRNKLRAITGGKSDYLYLFYYLKLAKKEREELLIMYPNSYITAYHAGLLLNHKFDIKRIKGTLLERIYLSNKISMSVARKAGLIINKEVFK